MTSPGTNTMIAPFSDLNEFPKHYEYITEDAYTPSKLRPTVESTPEPG